MLENVSAVRAPLFAVAKKEIRRQIAESLLNFIMIAASV